MGSEDVGAVDGGQPPKRVTLIVPAAGKSSRFPGMRPKWMLTQPSGLPMVLDSLLGLDMTDVGRIVFVFLAEHVRTHGVALDRLLDRARSLFDCDIAVVKLAVPTRSQPETVAWAIESAEITGPIFVKDSDNRFVCGSPLPSWNSVAVHDINSLDLIHVANKSFVEFDENGIVSNIVEKRVISQHFCVGGYSFADAARFVSAFRALENDENLYVSHVIFKMMLDGELFFKTDTRDYVDWGTAREWHAYRDQFVTLFIDIDGVIVKNSSEFCHPLWGSTPALEKSLAHVNRLHAEGRACVILTTSRPESMRDETIDQLRDLGVRHDQVIFGLPHTRRVIVNDYTTTNPYRSCDAINVVRDSDTLADMLAGLT